MEKVQDSPWMAEDLGRETELHCPIMMCPNSLPWLDSHTLHSPWYLLMALFFFFTYSPLGIVPFSLIPPKHSIMLLAAKTLDLFSYSKIFPHIPKSLFSLFFFILTSTSKTYFITQDTITLFLSQSCP